MVGASPGSAAELELVPERDHHQGHGDDQDLAAELLDALRTRARPELIMMNSSILLSLAFLAHLLA
jgi:hypothetical protein